MTPMLGDFLEVNAIQVSVDEYEVPLGVLQIMATEFGVDDDEIESDDILVLSLADGSEVKVASAEMVN